MDFNEAKETYRETIEDSIRFIGKDHEFFTVIKAKFLKNIAEQVFPKKRNLRLLDIGCGHGFIHKYLQDEGFDVVGTEMATEVLELARQANPTVTYVDHNGKTLDFKSESFDMAIAICVMHHVEPKEWNSFLIEMKRIIKPGGIAVIFEHNPFNPLTRYVVSKNILDKDAVLLSRSTLERKLLAAGFQSIKSRFILFTPFANAIFRWLDQVLGRFPFGAQYFSVATK